MDKEIVGEAWKIIERRRAMAFNRQEKRKDEIRSKIPEINKLFDEIIEVSREALQSTQSGFGGSELILKMSEKIDELSMKIEECLKKNGYSKDYLDVLHYCKKCDDTGSTKQGLCDCFTSLCKKLQAEKLNENTQLSLCCFVDFSLDFYKGKDRQMMSKILDFCKKYAENFENHSDSILMMGSTGLGKTHLSLSIANWVKNDGFSVIYDSAISILGQMEKEHFGKSETDMSDAVINADLLIIDDLGTEYQKEFYKSAIYNIINTRMSKNLSTIISTNLSLEEIQGRYDSRIVSRLISDYTCLGFSGEDIRFQKRRLNNG